MENSWQEFIYALSSDNETEYGDFKREMDHQLRRLVETSPPLNEKQAREIVRIREEYLWQDHPDEEIESIKRELLKRIVNISLLH